MFARTALALTLLIGSTLLASAHEFKLGDLLIGHPWSRATPGGAKIGGGYMTITNNGSAPDKLLSATTSVADHVEIHEMAMANNVMTMRKIDSGVTVEPGKTVAFSPGGYHLMLVDLKAPLKEGDRVKATLTFEKAGSVEVTINVEGIGAQHPAPGKMQDMDHSQHKM
ncbi:MAG TPA: copper chaperone PCu(A)C [Pseudolabrys sp.]